MSESEYKDLNKVHLDTVKELSQIVREQAKLLGQKSDTCCKSDTRCKYICISVIAVALFVTIGFCCIYGQRSKAECDHVHGTVKVKILKE